MLGFKFLGNTHVPHNKNTARMSGIRVEAPKEILLLMSQHIGAPATPIVKVGDEVFVGQKVAEAGGFVSSPIYSSVSGKVTKIESFTTNRGVSVPAIRIESDGLMTKNPEITPPDVNSLEELVSAIRESGVVGLGGAGFPTAVKLDALKNGTIDTVVINGSECEPYLTSDTRTMLDDSLWVRKGVELFLKFAPSIKSVILGVENNKPVSIETMKKTVADMTCFKVVELPSRYPQGAEKVLIYNTTGRVVPEGKLPADVGVVVINVTTLAFIAKYVDSGFPLVERTITVDGSAVKEPKNLIVPIGTAARDVLELAGGVKDDLGKVLFGGPMMGYAISSLDEPTTKTTGGITAFSKKDCSVEEGTACIHCGRCVAACPHLLNPTKFSAALSLPVIEEKVAMLSEYRLSLCVECGCCSFVCPAKRPLVQNNRLAKADVAKYKAHQASLKK